MLQVVQVRSRRGLRPSATAVRNGAELLDAHTKHLKQKYTGSGMAVGKDCALNKELIAHGLDVFRCKHDRCERLASFYLSKNMNLD